MSRKPEISFLIVHYKNEKDLVSCINDLERVEGGSCVEILVANNTPDKELRLSSDMSVRVIDMPGNIGFGSGHNALARRASGKYICILNPDTHHFSGSFKPLIKTLKLDNVAIVSPIIMDTEGSVQMWSYGLAVTPIRLVWQNISKLCGSLRPLQAPDQQIDADWVTGAALCIQRSEFIKQGGFDEEFFLYYEDIDLCKRVKDGGQRIIVDPSLTLVHNSGGSSEGEKSQKKHYFHSQDIYFQKHFGKSASIIRLLRKLMYKV